MKRNQNFDHNHSQKVLSCRYNMDTNRAEARFEDGTTLSIDCIAIEDEYGNTPAQRAELDWLLYNNPLSSAITKQPLGAIFAAARAFISAFSENVLPSSSGGSNPLNSPAPNTSQSSLAFANISRNSDILCALEVAMQIFIRLIFPPRCNPACRREVLL